MIDRLAQAIEPQWATASRNTRENARITVRELLRQMTRLSAAEIDAAVQEVLK